MQNLYFQANQTKSIKSNQVENSDHIDKIQKNVISPFEPFKQNHPTRQLKQLNQNDQSERVEQKEVIYNQQLTLYKQRTQQLQVRLKQKNVQIKHKDEKILKMSQTIKQLQKQKHYLQSQIQKVKQGSRYSLTQNNLQIQSGYKRTIRNALEKQKQIQRPEQQQVFKLSGYKQCSQTKQSSYQLQLIQLRSQVQKYKKKYLIIEQNLKRRTDQFQNQVCSLNKKIKIQREINQGLKQQKFYLEGENIQLTQKLQEMIEEIQRPTRNDKIQSSTLRWKDGDRFSFGQAPRDICSNFFEQLTVVQQSLQSAIELRQQNKYSNKLKLDTVNKLYSNLYGLTISGVSIRKMFEGEKGQAQSLNKYDQKDGLNQTQKTSWNYLNHYFERGTNTSNRLMRFSSIFNIKIDHLTHKKQLKSKEQQSTQTLQIFNQNKRPYNNQNKLVEIKRQQIPKQNMQAHYLPRSSTNRSIGEKQTFKYTRLPSIPQDEINEGLQSQKHNDKMRIPFLYSDQLRQAQFVRIPLAQNVNTNKTNMSAIQSDQKFKERFANYLKKQEQPLVLREQDRNNDTLSRIKSQLEVINFVHMSQPNIYSDSLKNTSAINITNQKYQSYKNHSQNHLKIIAQNKQKDQSQLPKVKRLKSSYLLNHEKYSHLKQSSQVAPQKIMESQQIHKMQFMSLQRNQPQLMIQRQYSDWMMDDSLGGKKYQKNYRNDFTNTMLTPEQNELIITPKETRNKQNPRQNQFISSSKHEISRLAQIQLRQRQNSLIIKRSKSKQLSKRQKSLENLNDFKKTLNRNMSLASFDTVKRTQSPKRSNSRINTFQNMQNIVPKVNCFIQFMNNSQTSNFITRNVKTNSTASSSSFSIKDLIAYKCKKLTIQ